MVTQRWLAQGRNAVRVTIVVGIVSIVSLLISIGFGVVQVNANQHAAVRQAQYTADQAANAASARTVCQFMSLLAGGPDSSTPKGQYLVDAARTALADPDLHCAPNERPTP